MNHGESGTATRMVPLEESKTTLNSFYSQLNDTGIPRGGAKVTVSIQTAEYTRQRCLSCEPTPVTLSLPIPIHRMGWGRDHNGAPTLWQRVWFVDFVDFVGAKPAGSC